MRNRMLKSALPLLLLVAGATSALAAGSEDDYKAAYAAAEAANKEAGSLAQPMDHDGGNAGGGEEVRRRRRIRQGDGFGQGSRSAGEGFDLPGHQRKETLEGYGNSLEHDPEKWTGFRLDNVKSVLLRRAETWHDRSAAGIF